MTQSASPHATLDDFWAIPEAARFHELIGGEILPKAAPSGEHGAAQAGTIGALRLAFHRSAAGRGDGYVTLMRAERGETLRPEPFEQIELAVGTLFGDDPPEPA